MSDINFGASIRVAKDNLVDQLNVSGITASMDVAGMKRVTLDLTGTPVSVDTTGIATLGMAMVRNISTHTAATVALSANGATFCSQRYAEPAIFRMVPGQTYTALGTVGSRVDILITEG